jgi:uncharacterized membrane protein
MPIIRFSFVAALVLLAGDSVIIPLIMRPLFAETLGAQMLDVLRLGPALLFYLIHIAGLVWFAGIPFLADHKRARAGLNGAALGFVAYSCYEMTSWTIMRDWHIGLVLADIAWGTVISGLSAFAGAMGVHYWRRSEANP